MERHHLTPADIEKKTEIDGRPPVSAVPPSGTLCALLPVTFGGTPSGSSVRWVTG